MKSLNTIATLLLACSLLIACGGGGDGDGDVGVGVGVGGDGNNALIVENQKQFVLDVMSEYYLFYDQMPTIDLRNYDTPEEVLDALIVSPDRFSYIADRAAQENFFNNGTFEGLGYARSLNADNSENVVFVFSDSPAGRPCPGSSSSQACLQRGDIITNSIRNGNDIQLNVNRNGSVFSVILPISTVRINTVIATDVQNHNGINVGYLALTAFLAPTVAELDIAFAFFKQNNVDELVLDLRYNGGGFVDTAQVLASYIAGINGFGSAVTRLEWNDRNTQRNEFVPFLELEDQLDLTRLYVLTLDGTCSASELVINAMEGISGVDVITVGQTTCGKPVGSVNFNFDDKVLQTITFRVVNDIGNGDYFNGIEPTCFALDDLGRDFADPTELMYAGALYHMANNTCEFIALKSLDEPQPSTFNPNPMGNLF